MQHLKYRPDIDGLRAIAVLSVVAFHAFPERFKSGFIGVDIFFVISGFLISTIIFKGLDSGSFSFKEFFARRIRRIFPALILVMVASLIAGWFLLLAHEYKQLGKHISGGASFISNFILWGEAGYFDSNSHFKPMLHLWSLGVEEQFYIFWPLILWFAWKKHFNLLSITILFALTSFFININGINVDAIAVFYLPITRFWELLFGVMLAYISLYKPNLFSKTKQRIDGILGNIIYSHAPKLDGSLLHSTLSIIGCVAIAVGMIMITKESPFPSWWGLLPVLGTCFIISAGPSAWFNRAVLSNKLFVWFGLISFPLYLWHWPLLSFLHITEPDMPSRNSRIACVVVSIIFAWMTYRFIEKPIRFGNDTKIKTIFLCISMMAIGGLGYGIYALNGMGFRLPKPLNFEDARIDKEWLSGRCFVDQGGMGLAALAKDKNECVTRSTGKLLYLWGDSFAAALYPGLKQLQATNNIGLAHFTAAACPPSLGWVHPMNNCNNINDDNISFLRGLKPDIVLLHSTWTYNNAASGVTLQEGLKRTVEELRKIGIPRIIVLGPPPLWTKPLPNILFHGLRKREYAEIPEYMKEENGVPMHAVDEQMRNLSKELGVEYISAYQEMCNQGGCRTWVNGDQRSITTYDNGHLTPAGSIWLINAIKDKILLQ